MERKVFVDVVARFCCQLGQVLPQTVYWEDGTAFEVDRVLDVRPAASLKAGGAGTRYTVRIRGRQTYLFREEDRWFVERRGQG